MGYILSSVKPPPSPHNQSNIIQNTQPNAPEFYLNKNFISQTDINKDNLFDYFLKITAFIAQKKKEFSEHNLNNPFPIENTQPIQSDNLPQEPINPQDYQVLKIPEVIKHLHQQSHQIEDKSSDYHTLSSSMAGSLLKDIRQLYKFTDVLGEGHFGAVRVCYRRFENPRRYYAIKSISKKNLTQKDLEDLIREVDIISNLDHPNIIKFYESYHDQYYFHIVMELCRGKEIFEQILEKGLIQEQKVIAIITKVLHAISYCHSRGITHRDLKPENILFDSNEIDADVKLIDFGLSRKYDSDQKMHTILGTPYYIAPEVLRGNYNEKCDIWGIGAVAYVMLCGDPPFKGNSNPEIFNKILTEEIHFDKTKWQNISKDAQAFILQCMKKNPEERPNAIQILKHPWFSRILGDMRSNLFLNKRILTNLKNFASSQTHRLKKMVLKYITTMMTKKELGKYKAAFYSMDYNHCGSLGQFELERAFQLVKMDINLDSIQRILFSSENNQRHKLDYTEFLIASLNQSKVITKERLISAFKYFDINNSGMIEHDDLKDSLLRYGKRTVHPDEINRMIYEAIKLNKDSISLDEFIHIFEVEC